jgi:hypothetical protein
VNKYPTVMQDEWGRLRLDLGLQSNKHSRSPTDRLNAFMSVSRKRYAYRVNSYAAQPDYSSTDAYKRWDAMIDYSRDQTVTPIKWRGLT